MCSTKAPRPLHAGGEMRDSLRRTMDIAAIVIARRTSMPVERAGALTPLTVRTAEAGPPAGTPIPVTCDVTLVILPVIVACMWMGTLQDAPAPRVTCSSVQPLPVNTAAP